jgi:hypothetical protein
MITPSHPLAVKRGSEGEHGSPSYGAAKEARS